MREKKEWLIVTFDTTTDAMRMEEEAKKAGLPGRIIPLPTQISAGCGLSWRAEPDAADELKAFMDDRCIPYDQMVLIEGRSRAR